MNGIYGHSGIVNPITPTKPSKYSTERSYYKMAKSIEGMKPSDAVFNVMDKKTPKDLLDAIEFVKAVECYVAPSISKPWWNTAKISGTAPTERNA